MKKILCALLIMAMFFAQASGIIAEAKKATSEYAKVAIVIKVNHKTNVVTCKDYTGNLWKFKGCEDWMIGDIVGMVMNDNGTPNKLKDDKIVNVRYNGTLSGWK